MYKYTSELRADELGIDVKKSNSSIETPNVITVGVEKYGLTLLLAYSLTRLLAYSLTRLLAYSLARLLAYSLTLLLPYSLTCFSRTPLSAL
jgi:hypothetical protein